MYERSLNAVLDGDTSGPMALYNKFESGKHENRKTDIINGVINALDQAASDVRFNSQKMAMWAEIARLEEKFKG